MSSLVSSQPHQPFTRLPRAREPALGPGLLVRRQRGPDKYTQPHGLKIRLQKVMWAELVPPIPILQA